MKQILLIGCFFVITTVFAKTSKDPFVFLYGFRQTFSLPVAGEIAQNGVPRYTLFPNIELLATHRKLGLTTGLEMHNTGFIYSLPSSQINMLDIEYENDVRRMVRTLNIGIPLYFEARISDKLSLYGGTKAYIPFSYKEKILIDVSRDYIVTDFVGGLIFGDSYEPSNPEDREKGKKIKYEEWFGNKAALFNVDAVGGLRIAGEEIVVDIQIKYQLMPFLNTDYVRNNPILPNSINQTRVFSLSVGILKIFYTKPKPKFQ